MNFRVARLNGFRRVFAHVAPIFFERGVAKPETKVNTNCSSINCNCSEENMKRRLSSSLFYFSALTNWSINQFYIFWVAPLLGGKHEAKFIKFTFLFFCQDELIHKSILYLLRNNITDIFIYPLFNKSMSIWYMKFPMFFVWNDVRKFPAWVWSHVQESLL